MTSFHQPSPERASQQPSSEAFQETIAELTAENRKLREENKRLKEVATTDTLTGILNRRGLVETASYLFPSKEKGAGEENRSGSPEQQHTVAIFIADIDNFKIVNDTYGHEEGDLVIQQVSAFLKKKFRTTDIVCRWGGEEFVVVVRGAEAQDIINKFYEKTDGRAEVNCEIVFNKDKPNEEKTILTLSGGVTDLIPGETIDDAVARADKGLYEAKEGGRNRIRKVPSRENK
jgi:diguanylate cyclase (GGDEF)-like protein